MDFSQSSFDVVQVWFQNRRAKFRKQERLNQQKQAQQSSSQPSSSSASSTTSSTNNCTDSTVTTMKEGSGSSACIGSKDTKPPVLTAINTDTKTVNATQTRLQQQSEFLATINCRSQYDLEPGIRPFHQHSDSPLVYGHAVWTLRPCPFLGRTSKRRAWGWGAEIERGKGAAEVMLPLSRFLLTLTETNGAHQKPFTELPRPIWYHVDVVFSPFHPRASQILHLRPPALCHTPLLISFFLVSFFFPFGLGKISPSVKWSTSHCPQQKPAVAAISPLTSLATSCPTSSFPGVLGSVPYPLSSIDTKPALASMF
ncbi:hypothetical protein AVEN_172421-1 [Araneus ventricosus]|uniref:Homeobox domain-containing protein n=1 Tax=Araneus ventricosus TaxID=182803 RepID=A0A4Y2RF68_ARAVE|nr:hypothetical protein AVEN_172421-1 [Araneus ventricosus]